MKPREPQPGDVVPTPAIVHLVHAGPEYQVRLSIGVQSFNINDPRPKDEAEWMADMLRKALAAAGVAPA